MRILHLDTEKTWRGGENQIRLLIEGLVQETGVENHIIAPPESLLCSRLAKTSISSRPLAKIHPLPLRGEWDIFAARKIALYCKEKQIDILDAQTSHAHSLALLAQKFGLQAKLIVHRRVDYVPKVHFFNQVKYRNNGISRYITISRKIHSILADFGIDQHKITTVPSAVDPNPFLSIHSAKARESLLQKISITKEQQSNTLLVGNASAFTEQKGYDTLLEALALLKQKNIPFHFVAAGDGYLRPQMEALCKSLGLEKEVTFLGWIQEIPEFLSALDILCVPSNYEGLGTIILDGIYAGCCIVATDVGGIPEMITHEKNGLLSPPKDPKALSHNLAKALSSSSLRASFNAAAKIHIQEHFSLHSMVEGNLRVYQEVLHTPN